MKKQPLPMTSVADNAAAHVQPEIAAVLAFPLRIGQRVLYQSEQVGTIRLLRTSPLGTVQAFVMHPSARTRREVVVPAEWVETTDRQQVHLKGEQAALTQLPRYFADSVIAVALERALAGAEVLNSRRFNDFAVTVHDGRVLLRGHVMRTSIKKQVEQVASQTRGVLSVDNQLVADDALESEVAQALSAVTAGHDQRLFVNARQGVIDLSGKASSAAVRDAAERCAARVSHVRAVVNHIEAPEIADESAETRVVQPHIGQEVMGKDMTLGKVELVIISPHNRRVSAMVVRGKFPDWAQVTRPMLPDDMPRLRRRVVIPLSAVRHVNQYDVLLDISGVEAARLPDFDPALFAAADATWLPPYPYHTADVLLEVPAGAAEPLPSDSQQGLQVAGQPA